MMAAWLLYTLLTTLLLLAAGSAGEQMMRALRVPSRFVWMSVILATMALSTISLASRTATQASPAVSAPMRAAGPAAESRARPAGVVFTVPRMHAPSVRAQSTLVTRLRQLAELRIDATRWQRFDALLAALCTTLAVGGLLVVVGSLLRLRRMTKALRSGKIDDVEVLVSDDLGPAAVGFLRRRVLVPHWMVALPAEERRTILLHEQEHATAGDPVLVLLGVLALAVQPWNVPLWIAVARLRFALEADCDARVLRRSGCGARRYGALLLQVHQHEFVNRVRGRFAVTAFVDSTSHLERRVRRMTDHQPRLRSLSTAAAFVAVVLCAGVAFSLRVSIARAAETLNLAGPERAPVFTAPGIPVAPPSELDSAGDQAVGTQPAVHPLLRSALPVLANTERSPSQSIAWSGVKGTVAIWLARAESRADVAPETLLVRASNAMWPLKARITTLDSAGMSRVMVTDTLGRMLPSADTLVVNGPVRLVLPDARFQLRVESLSGDMMFTTSATQGQDPRRGRWVATLLGRDFRASRGSSGESTRFSSDGPAIGKSQRVP